LIFRSLRDAFVGQAGSLKSQRASEASGSAAVKRVMQILGVGGLMAAMSA